MKMINYFWWPTLTHTHIIDYLNLLSTLQYEYHVSQIYRTQIQNHHKIIKSLMTNKKFLHFSSKQKTES